MVQNHARGSEISTNAKPTIGPSSMLLLRTDRTTLGEFEKVNTLTNSRCKQKSIPHRISINSTPTTEPGNRIEQAFATHTRP